VKQPLTLPIATLSGTMSNTPGSAAAIGRSRHRPRLAQQHREQRRPLFWTAAVSYASAVSAVSATATCANRLLRGPNLRVQLCRTLNVLSWDGNGVGVVAAACFRRPEQEDSKSNSSRTRGPSRVLSQSRWWCLAVRGGQTSRRIRVGPGGRADSFQAGHASSTLVVGLDRPLSFRDLGPFDSRQSVTVRAVRPSRLHERPGAFTQFAALTRRPKACRETNYPREGR
jgi:hypothetical protein